jgi:uncharacterized membrane protein YfcA
MTLILFILINTFAAVFQGVVGFGQGLVATPLSLTILDKNTVLTAVILAGGVVLNLSLYRRIKEPLNKDLFWPLFIGCVVGMPFGLLILKLLPVGSLKELVGSLSILLTLTILFVKIKLTHINKIAPVAGFISGILQTSAGMAGPPAVLLLTAGAIDKNSMRKILVVYFFWISLITLPLYALSHVLTAQGILFGLILVPFMFYGAKFGNEISAHVPYSWYKILALVTVGASGAIAIISGLK